MTMPNRNWTRSRSMGEKKLELLLLEASVEADADLWESEGERAERSPPPLLILLSSLLWQECEHHFFLRVLR